MRDKAESFKRRKGRAPTRSDKTMMLDKGQKPRGTRRISI